MTHVVMSCVNTIISLLYWDITAERELLLTTFKLLIINEQKAVAMKDELQS